MTKQLQTYDTILKTQKITCENAGGVEIILNELRMLKMSADFFANTSYDICRSPGV